MNHRKSFRTLYNSGNPVVGEEDLANSHDPFDDDVDEVIQCDL